MLRPRNQRRRPLRDLTLPWSLAPRMILGIEVLEDRFLLAGGATRASVRDAAQTAGGLSGAATQAILDTLDVTLGSGLDVTPAGDGSTAQASIDVRSALAFASGASASAIGRASAGESALFRLPLDATLSHVQIALTWATPPASAAGELELLDSSGHVLLSQPLTDQPLQVSFDTKGAPFTAGESVYVQVVIEPQPGIPAVPMAAEYALGVTRSEDPVSTAGVATAGVSTTAATGVSFAEAPTAVTRTTVAAPSAVANTAASPWTAHPFAAASFSAMQPASAEGQGTGTLPNAFVLLPSAHGVPAGGVLGSNDADSDDHEDGVAVDPVLADLMPLRGDRAQSLAPSIRPSASASSPDTAIPIVSGTTSSHPAPLATLVLGPLLAPASNGGRGTAGSFSMTAEPFPFLPGLAPLSEAVLDLVSERAELPALPPRRAGTVPPIVVARPTAVVATAVAPLQSTAEPRREPARSGLVAGGVFASSVLILGASAPTLNEALRRWRRRPNRREASVHAR